MISFKKITSRVTETHWSKLYVSVAVLQCVVIVILQSLICYQNARQANLLPERTTDNALDSSDVLLAIDVIQAAADRLSRIKWENIAFIGFQFWFVAMVLDATVYQNTAEVLALAVFNVMCALLGGLQVVDGVRWLKRINAVNPNITQPLAIAEKLEISLCVVILVFACAMTYLSYEMSRQFGWNIYKKIGADVQIQKMYRMFQFFVLSLKINIFIEFLVSVFYIIQRCISETQRGQSLQSIQPATWLQIACTAVTLPMLYFARHAGSIESKLRMIIFILFQVVLLFHFAFVLVQSVQPRNSWYTWIVLISVGILMDLTTIALGCICMKNFNKGLKPYVQRGDRKQDIETPSKLQNNTWQIDED
ncbi:hypothetical protein BDF14DRAFT_1830709 [Spinellus fusiger]|nr:hypothetical protein BDF14DRAFT_1830709 [Spinellus fusiger]